MTQDAQQSPTKQALLKIRELKQQLDAALANPSADTYEPIAVVSMACRFPRQSRTPELFWQSLLEQTDEVSDIPESRWDHDAFHDDDPEAPGKMYANRGVFLDDLDQMDPEFFGISPREATWVDPQQRLLMEVGWEAIERAGWVPERIGDETGVFVGWMHNDYQNEASDSFLNLNPYIATGAAGSFLCGRLAYYLGLHGPSIAVDTACSSSLVALHLAIQSLQRRDCDRALVGGVNAICSPTTNILTCKLKALSPTGQSRAFDAAADGYLRGEGCGIVTLRRLEDAKRAGDPILGVVLGSAVGHNGFGSGLTVPNPKAQEQVIRAAIQRARLKPEDVAYLEAHGTGTELGDPIEMRAAATALSGERTADNPLLVGSVKTNIGHLEAAAGMAGLIKVLLSIQHGRLAGQLNFEEPNPHIPWDSLPVKVLTDATDWPAEKRIAGVSAFGMSGTNAHVVVGAPDSLGSGVSKTLVGGRALDSSQSAETGAVAVNGATQKRASSEMAASAVSLTDNVLTLSAKSEDALFELASEHAAALREQDQLELPQLAYTTNVCRTHFQHRVALVSGTVQEAAEKLDAFARTGSAEGVVVGDARRSPRVAWQFTGQGSQYVGMSRRLYETTPIFRDVIDACDKQLTSLRSNSSETLKQVLFASQEDPNARINDTAWTQPAIFAVQMGLAKLLGDAGLQPDVVLGHSVGQYAAACVAGVMTWEEGLQLISHRGHLIGQLPAGGRMAAVFASVAVVEQAIVESDVSLAAINGTHVVISGPDAELAKVEERLSEQGIKTKSLTTSHAFHSPLMDPALEPFQSEARKIDFQPAKLPLVCNVTGRVLGADQTLDAEYWAKHIRQPVRYAESVDAVTEAGCELLIELGPQPILTRMAAAKWQASSDTLISTLDRQADDLISIQKAIAKLFVLGATPDFESLHADNSGPPVSLPTYPFQRRRFWGPDKPRAMHAAHHTAHPLLGGEISLAGAANEKRYESFIDVDSPSWLPDHQVMGSIVMPGAAYVEMALSAAGSDAVADITFEHPLRPNSRTALQTVVRTASAEAEEKASIETFSSAASDVNGSTSWARNFSAKFVAASNAASRKVDRAAIEASLNETVSPAEFYQTMRQTGLEYGDAFQTIDSIRFSEREVLAELKTVGDVRGFTIPPTLLDGALHSLAVGLTKENDGYLFLPVGIGRVDCYRAIEDVAWCHAIWKENEGKMRTADLTLFDDGGNVLVSIGDLRVEQVSVESLRRMSGIGPERLTFQLDWEPTRLGSSVERQTRWLLIRSQEVQNATTADVAKKLKDDGHEVVEMVAEEGDAFANQLTVGDRFQGIAWFVSSDIDAQAATKQTCTALLKLIDGLNQAGYREIECGLQLITSSAISTDVNDESEHVNPHQAKYWGLGRVVGAERPTFRCRLIDLSSDQADDEKVASAITDVLLTETVDNQFALRDGQILVPRMKRVRRPKGPRKAFTARSDHSYLITGGLGMLGRQAALWLAEQGAGEVVLVSRRQPDDATKIFIEEIEAIGCRVVVHSADISDRDSVQQLFARFGDDLLPLTGVIHTAGVLDDGTLDTQSWERFEKVLRPKVAAAELLHEFTQSMELDLFVLYSSAASVLGSPGQSNYATGNAYLDGLAWQRRSAGLPANSINWGPWTEGMADDQRIIKRMALQGIAPLSVSDAHAAMELLIGGDVAQATVMDVDWSRMRASMAGAPLTILDRLAGEKRATKGTVSALVEKLRKLDSKSQRELLVTTIQNSLQSILSTPSAPDTDRPLIEMGLDSLMAVEFGAELQQLIGDQFSVSPAMLFDHPTIDAISDHVLQLITDDESGESKSGGAKVQPIESTVDAEMVGRFRRDDVAIIGMSCRFPGARNVEEYWQNLMDGVDSVRDIPNDRWDIDRFFSEKYEPGKMVTRQGGFIDDIAEFDPAFFNISPQEACWIDPQHRMLLENSYHAMEDAGVVVDRLPDNKVGVFMGIMGQDYAFLPTLDDRDVIEGFRGAGLSHSAGVGRISYLFGFEGPSVAVDTASSSSLVALFQAVRSLQENNCNLALAGGVNAILAPVNSLLMSKAGLLSPDGRCKSFSAGANGFGRGEGCGVVVLKRLSDARRDGDQVLAVVRGAAVMHNGYSSGITSPSGKAQGRVIEQALRDARIAPSEVQYLEAHGTGTEYGDPIELSAAAAVYGKGRAKGPTAVGWVGEA